MSLWKLSLGLKSSDSTCRGVGSRKFYRHSYRSVFYQSIKEQFCIIHNTNRCPSENMERGLSTLLSSIKVFFIMACMSSVILMLHLIVSV